MMQTSATEPLESASLEKLELLQKTLLSYKRIAVAFSGGVDSTLLLKVAHDVLGDEVVAVTGRSASMPAREIEEACAFCRSEGIEHIIVATREFDIEGFDHNPPDRCYHCKRELLARVAEEAARRGIPVIAEGSNLDDDGDYRPGKQAVIEMGVVSPLREAGLSKTDVRALAKYLGLAVWDKPAYACLNTRFAYGDLITADRLRMVDQAEEALRYEGFTQVRVRIQGETARIEVAPEQIELLVQPERRQRIVEAIKAAGFKYVALDLQGYRTGSMNETL